MYMRLCPRLFVRLLLKLLLVPGLFDCVAKRVKEFIHVKVRGFFPAYALGFADRINQYEAVPFGVESAFGPRFIKRLACLRVNLLLFFLDV